MSSSRTSSALVVTGGGPLLAERIRGREFDLVVAADSGLDRALAAGLTPHLLVGDLDSVGPDARRWALDHGLPTDAHPADKDLTDTAIALRSALASGATHVTLATPEVSDRFDHLLGALVALGDPLLASCCTVTAIVGTTTAHVVHPGRSVEVSRPPGAVFSLIALHGQCTGVDVTDARWPLTDATLDAGSTLGISNATTHLPARVSVGSGVLTVIVPEVLS